MLANIARQKKIFASNNLLSLNITTIISDIKFHLYIIKEKYTNNDLYDNNDNTSIAISMKITSCENFLMQITLCKNVIVQYRNKKRFNFVYRLVNHVRITLNRNLEKPTQDERECTFC